MKKDWLLITHQSYICIAHCLTHLCLQHSMPVLCILTLASIFRWVAVASHSRAWIVASVQTALRFSPAREICNHNGSVVDFFTCDLTWNGIKRKSYSLRQLNPHFVRALNININFATMTNAAYFSIALLPLTCHFSNDVNLMKIPEVTPLKAAFSPEKRFNSAFLRLFSAWWCSCAHPLILATHIDSGRILGLLHCPRRVHMLFTSSTSFTFRAYLQSNPGTVQCRCECVSSVQRTSLVINLLNILLWRSITLNGIMAKRLST